MKFSAAASSCSSLGEETLKFPLFRTIVPITNHGIYVMTTAASRKTRLDAIMIGRWWYFVAFNFEIVRFWRNGGIHFSSKHVYGLSISLSLHPLPNHVFRFGARVQFSCDTICAFNNAIKIRENRGLWTGCRCSDPSVSLSLESFHSTLLTTTPSLVKPSPLNFQYN